MRRAGLLAAVLFSTPVSGHSFGQPYQLPMPYWLYIYGAMAALVLSFVVFGLFVGRSHFDRAPRYRELSGSPPLRLLRRGYAISTLRAVVLLLFAFSVLTGLVGSRDPYRNFNMTFFWILFVLGGTYLSAVIGGWYGVLNPWRTLSRLCDRLWPAFSTGRFRYPAGLAYWPALVLYMGFIALELFGDVRPFSLSVALLLYTAINLLGVFLVGARAWFRHGEFFAVMFRLVSMMAPVLIDRDANGARRVWLRWPFVGLLGARIEHRSLLVFLLFMLSSTAFDGLSETKPWFNAFWMDPSGLLTQWFGRHPLQYYGDVRIWFIRYEMLCLVASPFLYLGAVALFLWLGKCLCRTRASVRDLAMDFGYSLLPIAVVYHVTHYYTLLLDQGVKIRALVSDPFGWGWNLFGTAITGRVPILPDMGVVWYSQVLLILLGHVASVYIAHAEALRQFRDTRTVLLSQIPVLALMVLFTGVGLWILAQPLNG